jgi:hypothetical protein
MVADANPRNEHAPRISCIVCAYNEAPRIGAVLMVATAHPMLAEIIGVDDGSTDTTDEVVRQFPSVRLIDRATNGGNSDLGDIQRLPCFGIEVFMNRRNMERRLRIAVTHWPHVTQARKTEESGYWQGVRAEWRMITDLLKAIYPLALISQTVRLLSLRISEGRAPFAARMSRASSMPR